MPTSSLVRAAFFTLGAAVGGGAVAALNASRKKSAPSLPTSIEPAVTAVGIQKLPNLPVVDVGVAGEPRFSTGVATAGGPILKYGNPGPIADQFVRIAYATGYDRRTRNPAWTAEHLTLASLRKSRLEESTGTSSGSGSGRTGNNSSQPGDRENSTFQEDEALPAQFRAKLQDYFRSGYDRGHMVPAADAKRSQEAMDETFLLSNIAPQVGVGFNRHYWAYLEDWCRRLTSSFTDVYVFTIPLYLPHKETDGKWRVTYEVIGNPPNVSVPTHFAKVVLTSRPSSPSTPQVPEISTGAFVLPNAAISDETSLESFVVPIDAVERAAGLTLFSDTIKGRSKHICKTTKCEVMVRRFDNAQKRPEMRRAISSPR